MQTIHAIPQKGSLQLSHFGPYKTVDEFAGKQIRPYAVRPEGEGRATQEQLPRVESGTETEQLPRDVKLS